MEKWNIELFLALNAGGAPDALTILAAKVAAGWFYLLAAFIVAALWVWGAPAKRGPLLTAAAVLALGLAINFAIALAWYHPRPFELGIGRTLVAHALETSFPSDHATFVLSLGFGLIAMRAWSSWGWLVTALGLATAWARVYLGLHFPFDMLGSFAVAAVSAAGVGAIGPAIERHAMPIVDPLYEAILRALHLPAAIFPRRPDDATLPVGKRRR